MLRNVAIRHVEKETLVNDPGAQLAYKMRVHDWVKTRHHFVEVLKSARTQGGTKRRVVEKHLNVPDNLGRTETIIEDLIVNVSAMIANREAKGFQNG